MMKALVGYTGFVGSNLCAAGYFDAAYHSSDISNAYGTKPDLLVYAGLRAEKYLANQAPEQDKALILEAEDNIRKICPRKLVLISTIDVFKVPRDIDEKSKIDTDNLQAYGYNRYMLEQWAQENVPDVLIVRLPALFGRNIKKNFIYDYMNVIPFTLNKSMMEELAKKDGSIKEYYDFRGNGFYQLKSILSNERGLLKARFRKIGFTALNFTDSRSRYQFYNLGRLWGDIQTALRHGIRIWHPAVEPVSAGELYEYLTGSPFKNELEGSPADYNYRTLYDRIFDGRDGYICSRGEILKEIKDFVEGYEK